ncbi:MAG: hypothetical protein HZA78_00975 [Candidatus Schekmanbacteria bacterium]|nr:hypothetical protein [Candidatus Schekmanbacteria bacterium]
MANTRVSESSHFGCGVKILLFALLIVFFAGAFFQVVNLLSKTDSIEYIATSDIAADRCREKFTIFNKNDYIRRVVLTELEINSAIQEEMKDNETGLFINPWINITSDSFIIGGQWAIINLIVPAAEVTSLNVKSKQSSLWEYRVPIKVSGELTVGNGELKLIPEHILMGKLDLPPFAINWFKKYRPNLFVYSVSPQIREVRLKSGAMELLK